ncbi:MAG: T9SS type A sorting domain-containing protein [bacterium]
MFKKSFLSYFILLCAIMNISYGEMKVVDTINLISGGNKVNGLRPNALCVLGNKVYVANSKSDSVSIIDTANNNSVTNIKVGDSPSALCVLENRVYVVNSGSNSVSIIDTANNNSVININVGNAPIALCVLGNKVYVVNSNSISIIDTVNNNKVTNISVGNYPTALCVLGTKVYVANSNSISIIDTANNNSVTNISVGDEPIALCVLGNRVYVANSLGGSISILGDDETTNINGLLINSSNNKKLSYPNPFNPECYIPLEITNNKSQNVKIKIYNILGQVVREVISSNANNSIYWDGRDNLGKEVSSGMYFYETIVNNKTQNCKKMLMLK